jgi:alcohol dehydrogenase
MTLPANPGMIDFQPLTRVIFGPGSVNELGQLVQSHGGTGVLLVTDPGILAAGHAARCSDLLTAVGVKVTIFSKVTPNPTTKDVASALELAKQHDVNCLVAVGGGSSMDCAKGVNFLFTNGGRIQDYWGIGKATKPMLPLVAVPTTAGTGSDAQSFALISDEVTHQKMACGDKKAACKAAILDPELTLSMPMSVAAMTGIDALSHAIESFVCTRKNAISRMFAREAFGLLATAFPRILTHPSDIEARGKMLLGAHLAGAAIENSMLGATHSLANPLTATYETPHGMAIGVMLPHVIRYNSQSVAHDYGLLGSDIALCSSIDPLAGTKLAQFVTSCVQLAKLPTQLVDCGVLQSDFDLLAASASEQWTATFNPRSVDTEDFRQLYKEAY